jgi:type I restriction-modification system DNA methylase subunit
LPEIHWISPPRFDKKILNDLQQLINEYENKYKSKEAGLNEKATGQAFVEPLLTILGWNIRDLDEVYPEYYVTGSGRVDYVLKINAAPVVYIEIKKLGESLDGVRGGKSYEDQAMDYAWKKRATWAVLTNFKEMRLYNAKERVPVFCIFHQDYPVKFEATLQYLTKEAVKSGEIGQLYAVKTGKEIEDDFLKDLQKWRLELANNIHSNNALSLEEISSQTQKILNRLTLTRIAEDRGSLPRGQLQNEYAKWKTSARSRRRTFFEELKELFQDFEFDFNTELFRPDLCDSLTIDNTTFDVLVKGLYEYDFSTLTGDILGSTYELYLGYSLEPIDKNYLQSKNVPKEIPLELLLKNEYRQREGIFYTRPPVVDFIVSNTVVPKIEATKTENVQNLHILDASGGSGSFLIKALTVIRNYLLMESLKSRKSLGHKNPFHSELAAVAVEDIPKLVLSNNLYLVDLDPESVGIAKLNLWAQSLHPARPLSHEKVLLNLENTFKCGNSLVSSPSDFPELPPDAVETKIKPFNWSEKFPEIFPKDGSGGFDVVIGNPPYYSVHFLDDYMKNFLQSHYSEIHTGQNDILYYFYKRGIDLLKEGGLLGFITAKYFLKAEDSSKLRGWILNNCKIRTIIDFGNIDMFGGLGTRTAVLILEKCTGADKQTERTSNTIQVAKVRCRRWLGTKRELVSLIEKHLNEEHLYKDAIFNTFTVKQCDLTVDPWELISQEEKKLKTKIESMSVPLDSLCYCCKGMDTGLNEVKREDRRLGVFHLTGDEVENLQIEPEILRKIVKNSDIERYLIDFKGLFLVYATDGTDITAYPNAKAHLERFRNELTQRYGFDDGRRKWFAISSPRHKELIDSSQDKLVCPYIASENKFAYDDCSEDHRYYGMTDTTSVVRREECTENLKYILAVLNSTLENFYHRTFSKAKDYRYEYFAKNIAKLCVPDHTKFNEQKRPIPQELADLSSELIGLSAQLNTLRKVFSETLRNNLVDTYCDLKDYFNYSVKYCFQKTVLLDVDSVVDSCEIELCQEGNSITINAFFGEKWRALLRLDFSDETIKDFIYLSIAKFIRSEELSAAWRKGRIMADVLLGLKLPRFSDNHDVNVSRIQIFMAEVKSKVTSTDIGSIEREMRVLDRKINDKVYFIYDIDADEKRIIEEAIDFGRPYLRY